MGEVTSKGERLKYKVMDEVMFNVIRQVLRENKNNNYYIAIHRSKCAQSAIAQTREYIIIYSYMKFGPRYRQWRTPLTMHIAREGDAENYYYGIGFMIESSGSGAMN